MQPAGEMKLLGTPTLWHAAIFYCKLQFILSQADVFEGGESEAHSDEFLLKWSASSASIELSTFWRLCERLPPDGAHYLAGKYSILLNDYASIWIWIG